ncbi:MAG: M17 family peptidase N-terminal domain-containing protein, partial [Deltaproteobacteria bacterium]
MTDLLSVSLANADATALIRATGAIAIFAETPKLDPLAAAVDKATHGAILRAVKSEAFGKLDAGDALTLSFPAGLKADVVLVVKLASKAEPEELRKGGASIAAQASKALTIAFGDRDNGADLALGLMLKSYDFNAHKTA